MFWFWSQVRICVEFYMSTLHPRRLLLILQSPSTTQKHADMLNCPMGWMCVHGALMSHLNSHPISHSIDGFPIHCDSDKHSDWTWWMFLQKKKKFKIKSLCIKTHMGGGGLFRWINDSSLVERRPCMIRFLRRPLRISSWSHSKELPARSRFCV